MYQLQVLTGEELGKAVNTGEVTAPYPNLTNEFLVTSFNYLTGKWEGITNPSTETLMRACNKKAEREKTAI